MELRARPTCLQLAPVFADLLVRTAVGGRRGRLETVSSCDDASVRLSDEPFSLAVYSGNGKGEERREGRGEEGRREWRGKKQRKRAARGRKGRERVKSHYWMRLCCVPGSGTAMAPSLLENHREIFTDGRGGKKILHLDVRV